MTLWPFLPLVCIAVGCSTAKHAGEIENKWLAYGNPEADTVVVLAQNGPNSLLDTMLVDEIFLQSYLLDKQAVYILQVHQAQTRYPDKFELFEFSFEDAKIFNQESVDFLFEAVNISRQSGKKVYVVGISYGAFLVQELLAKQGNAANGYLLVAGRLDVEEAAWMTLADGTSVDFEDGTFIQPVFQDYGTDEMSPVLKANMNKLVAGLAFKRYTEKLNNVRMDNVIYAYNKFDERVGRLSDDEIEFLKSGKARVYTWETGENHSEFIDGSLVLSLEEMLELRSRPDVWTVE